MIDDIALVRGVELLVAAQNVLDRVLHLVIEVVYDRRGVVVSGDDLVVKVDACVQEDQDVQDRVDHRVVRRAVGDVLKGHGVVILPYEAYRQIDGIFSGEEAVAAQLLIAAGLHTLILEFFEQRSYRGVETDVSVISRRYVLVVGGGVFVDVRLNERELAFERDVSRTDRESDKERRFVFVRHDVVRHLIGIFGRSEKVPAGVIYVLRFHTVAADRIFYRFAVRFRGGDAGVGQPLQSIFNDVLDVLYHLIRRDGIIGKSQIEFVAGVELNADRSPDLGEGFEDGARRFHAVARSVFAFCLRLFKVYIERADVEVEKIWVKIVVIHVSDRGQHFAVDPEQFKQLIEDIIDLWRALFQIASERAQSRYDLKSVCLSEQADLTAVRKRVGKAFFVL